MTGRRAAFLVVAVVTLFALVVATTGCDRIRAELKARAMDAAVSATPIEPPLVDAGAVLGAAAAAPTISPAEARRTAWLTTPLTGRDNDVAAFRLVQITSDGKGGFRLFVKNQFKLACALSFDESGRPFEAKGCKGEWRSKEPVIRFSCKEQESAEVCRGPFTLVSPDSFSSPAGLEIVRPLTGASSGAKPAAPLDTSVCPRVCQKLAVCKRYYFANDKLETCATACRAELTEVDVAGRVVISSQLSCIMEDARPCQDLVTCGSVRVTPSR